MVTAPISLAGRSVSPAAATASKPKAASAAAPALIVFGYDEAGKAHASCFGPADAELAAKAATLMGYHALRLAGDSHAALAARLPPGRVFASGRAFVPYVKAATFEALATAAGVTPSIPAPKPKPSQAASGTDEPGTQSSTAHHLPYDWDQIKTGSVVLASEGEGDGWYEAVVIEIKPEDLFVVRWRDWPKEPPLVRRREHLGLIHPECPVGRS